MYRTNEEMLQAAMAQSAEDIGCRAEDFRKDSSLVVPLRPGPNWKRYYKLPIGCNFISYGSNVVAAASDELLPVAEAYVGKFEFYHCFETPNMHWLNERLKMFGQAVFFMAEYYLPDLNRLKKLPCAYELRILQQADFEDLYLPEWSNALCSDRKQLDVLGVGAYDRGTLVGLAGCSWDAGEMWQIGIDVLPEYRRQGIASALTSRLACEILERDKVPFYCSAWSNLRSVKNAIRSGFVPAWIEMTVKPAALVDEFNK